MNKGQVSMTSPFRKRTIRSLTGHVIPFERNETKAIPGVLVEEAIAAGLVPTEDIDVALGSTPQAAKKLTDDERDAKIRAAVETIMGRTEREDWNGQSKPAKAAVIALSGLSNADQRVINRIYADVLAERKEAEDGE